ncbi:MAG: Ig-like domain-containing protein [Prevotella sp.]|nr:Ig-like domain-containing protein [Prevotella sp.]
MIKHLRIFATMLLLAVFSGVWAETKTEGFENATAGTDYQGTVYVSAEKSQCNISWSIYYGNVSTSSVITGENSVALRLYTSSNYGYLKTTTPIDGLSNVTFKAKAATTNSAKILVNISYSTDGDNWITIETDKELTSSAESYSVNIPSGGKFFQIAISSNSTKPSKKNAQLTIDDVEFTYSASDKTMTTTAFADGTEDAYNVYQDATFTSPTATVSCEDEAFSGSVTYSSSNEDVATVNASTGTVTLVAAGTTTIKATYAGNETYASSSDSYILNVYGVYASLEALQTATNTSAVPMKLTLTNAQVTAITSNGNNAYIYENGFGALIYGATLNDILTVGETLSGTLEANVQLYNGMTEITGFSKNELTTGTADLTPTVITDLAQITKANQSGLFTIKNVTYDGSVLSDANGNSITPYATFGVATSNFTSGGEYHVTGIIVLYNDIIEIAPRTADDIVLIGRQEATLTATYETSLDINATDVYNVAYDGDGELSVSSSDESVATATINNGEVTVTAVALGTTTITISATQTDNYLAVNKSYELTVTDPNAFEATFVFNTETGLNALGIGIPSVASSGTNLISDNNPTGTYSTGDVTLIVTDGGTPTRIWKGSDGTSLDLRVYKTNGSLSFSVPEGYIIKTITMTGKNIFDEWTGSATKVVFKATSNKNIETVSVSYVEDPNYNTLSLVATDGTNYYATFSSSAVTFFPYSDEEIEFSTDVEKVSVEDNELVVDVLGTENATINGNEIIGTFVPANTGVLLKVGFDKEEKTIPYYTVTGKDVDALSENMLKPASEEMSGDYRFYKLAYNNFTAKTGLGFYWGAANGDAFSVKAGTAYLAVPSSSSTAKGFTLDGESTGISSISTTVDENAPIYNLSGQRVNKNYRGVVIQNGKKYFVK